MKKPIQLIALNGIMLMGFCTLISCSNQSGVKPNGNVANQKIAKEVTITFVDNAKLKVENLKFQYVWMFESDKKYYNPPTYTIESDDLHFGIKTHGVEQDSIIARDLISKIVFCWPKDIANGDYRSPDTMKVVLKDGNIKKIYLLDYRLSYKFVLDNPNNERRDIQFNQFNFIGFATINGKKENFCSPLSRCGAIEVKLSDSVKEIAF